MAEILWPDGGLLAGEHIGFDVAKVVSSPLLVGMSCSFAHIRFAVHPLLLAGRTAGHDNEPTPKLKLIAATPLPTGVVALCYQPDHTETV